MYSFIGLNVSSTFHTNRNKRRPALVTYSSCIDIFIIRHFLRRCAVLSPQSSLYVSKVAFPEYGVYLTFLGHDPSPSIPIRRSPVPVPGLHPNGYLNIIMAAYAQGQPVTHPPARPQGPAADYVGRMKAISSRTAHLAPPACC